MKRAVFPGSFDPITIGHCDIINRGTQLFDELIIAIGENLSKNYLFSLEQRKAFIENIFSDNKKIKVFKTNFKSLKYSLSKINERVFIKLITKKSDNKVVGLHYLGENAAEIIQGFSVAVVRGLKKSDFDKTIGIHPSSAEEIVTLK